MQEQNRKKIFIGAGGLFVLVVFILFGWLYYGKLGTIRLGPSPEEKYIAKYREASDTRHLGKIQEGIDLFNEALKLATTKSQETWIKLILARDIFNRNNGTDRVDSVVMYKNIIADTSVSPLQRAVAISDMLDLFGGNQDDAFAREVIFKGEPFQKYIDEAKLLKYGDDMQIEYATRRAYEFAETLYPLSLAEFRIAEWYNLALASVPAKDIAQYNDFISQLETWTDKGNANLAETLNIGYDTSTIGYIYQLGAMARGGIAEHGDKNYAAKNYAASEELFKESLNAMAPEDANAQTYIIGLYSRFHYASMLAAVYGDKRKADIEALLVPIIAATPANEKFKEFSKLFFEFFKNEMASTHHDTHEHKQDIKRLAQMVPAFKATVVAWGISF